MQQIITPNFAMNEAFLYFSAEIEHLLSVFATFAAVLVSPLPIPLEKSDEKGNQVQVLNRPAAVNPFKIFEYSISHCPVSGMGRHSKRDESEDLPRQHSFSAFGE